MAPLAKLMWFREREPDTFARVRRWVGVKELLVHRLTGEWVIDVSCASGTGLMSLARQDWDEEALLVAGVRRDQLARIVPSSEVVELASDDIGLPRGTPIVVGAGDGPLANFGLGAVKPGLAACSIGTSGALRLIVEEPGVDSAGRLFCYALLPGRWAIGGAINNGGVVLQWAMRALAPEFKPGSENELLDIAAGVPPGSDGLIMLPYLFSERAPYWDAQASGAYVGLRHFHGRAHLVRAAVEGVCQQLALVLGSMRDAGNEIDEVRATGGFARSPFWRQLLTDVLGLSVAFTQGREGTAFGAALLGMEALGIVDSVDRAVELVRIEETLEPDPGAAATYAEQLPLFARLHDDLGPVFSELDERRGRPGVPPAR
jgi:gluconokinase